MTKTRDLANLGGGFIQAGGGVQRAVEGRLKDVVSVLDFIPQNEHAAIKAGTSTYDATADIQSALDLSTSLFFPSGRYLITAELTLTSASDISITGENAELYATFNVNGDFILLLTSCSKVSVSGLTFKTNGTLVDDYPTDTRGITNGTSGLNLIGCSDCCVQNCNFTRVNKGIQLDGGSRNTVSLCRIFEVGRLGISPRETDHCVITDNIIDIVSGDESNKKYSDGIYIYASTNIVVANNTIEDVRRIGIVLEENGAIDPSLRPRNKRVIVANNVVQNAHDALSTEVNACIWVEPNCGDETCIITGNTCFDSDTFGIYGNSGVNVVNNVIYDCAYGIDATDGPFNVKGNTCTGCLYAGIRYRSALPGVIDGNTVKNNGQGIRIDSTSIVYNVTVSNNVIQDNDTRGLNFDFTAAGVNPQVTSQVINNCFISSGDEGVTTTQQPYGIWVNTNTSGISPYSYYRACNFEGNSFIYTGTFTTGYPGLVNVTPADLSIEGALTSLSGFNTSGKLGELSLGKAPLNETPVVNIGRGTFYQDNGNDFFVSSRNASGSSDLADLYLGAWSQSGAQDFVFWSRHNGFFAPFTDNARDLGGASFRWDDIYATNNVISTSDINEKTSIQDLSEAEHRVAVKVKGMLKKFKWKTAVEKKGNSARFHFGIIAQDLERAFIEEGLNTDDYGVFIKSEWWEETVVVDGKSSVKTYKFKEDAPESAVLKSRLGVRYNELLAFIIAAL